MWKQSEDHRKGNKWPLKRGQTNALVHGRCCLCGTKRDIHVHHLYYGFRLGFIHIKRPNLEIPGWSCVSLCEHHHYTYAHVFQNYIVDRRNNWNNRNTSKVIWTLRFRFWLMVLLLELFPLLFCFLFGAGVGVAILFNL